MKLLNQKLHEDGNTLFRFPFSTDKYSSGLTTNARQDCRFLSGLVTCFLQLLCVISPITWYGSRLCVVRVIINDNTFFYTNSLKMATKSQSNTYHLHLFHLKMENFNDNMDKALSENLWNHAEVDFGLQCQKSGIHVLKDKSSMKDIRFTNPEYEANIVLHSRCWKNSPMLISCKWSIYFPKV